MGSLFIPPCKPCTDHVCVWHDDAAEEVIRSGSRKACEKKKTATNLEKGAVFLIKKRTEAEKAASLKQLIGGVSSCSKLNYYSYGHGLGTDGIASTAAKCKLALKNGASLSFFDFGCGTGNKKDYQSGLLNSLKNAGLPPGSMVYCNQSYAAMDSQGGIHNQAPAMYRCSVKDKKPVVEISYPSCEGLPNCRQKGGQLTCRVKSGSLEGRVCCADNTSWQTKCHLK